MFSRFSSCKFPRVQKKIFCKAFVIIFHQTHLNYFRLQIIQGIQDQESNIIKQHFLEKEF